MPKTKKMLLNAKFYSSLNKESGYHSVGIQNPVSVSSENIESTLRGLWSGFFSLRTIVFLYFTFSPSCAIITAYSGKVDIH